MIKQVIVIRKDLKMRRGKEIAQGAHASMMWLLNRIEISSLGTLRLSLSNEEEAWIKGNFAKICLQVNSEKDLLDVYNKALQAGLNVELITDSGLTEFDGPTKTCLAIGPHESDKIDAITGDLKLY